MTRILGAYKILGVAFIALAVLAVYLVYAGFTKQFADYDEVTLRTTNVGLNLPERADVKIRGVIVGEVLETKTTPNGAEVTLGIYPDERDQIDNRVTASILPKTLFGEKFVSLIPPPGEIQTVIKPGDEITRTALSTEVEQVLNDLFPLLTTVQPGQINMTLNALATALEGRGEQLGENLETVDSYLRRLNPQIPALVEDLRLTSDVADIYTEVLPEIGNVLDNTVVTTTTVEDRERKLLALYRDVGSFSDTARSFLDANGDNLVELGDLSARQLRVLARYAPEFPCLTKGIVKAGAAQAEAFRGFKLHIILETIPRQPREYGPQDRPEINERRGPSCALSLPNPPWSQSNPVKRQPDFADGVEESTGKGTSRVPTGFGRVSTAYEATPQDNAALAAMLAKSGGNDSDLAVLLNAPLMAGGGG